MDDRWQPHVVAASLLLLVATASATCRVQDCPNFRAIRYYEELGCERSDGSTECCPTCYNCSSLFSVDKKKCFYNGKTYEHKDILFRGNWKLIRSPCISMCACYELPEGPWKGEGRFSCRAERCYQGPLLDTCWRSYRLDECCATGIHCTNDTEGTRNFTECPYKGKSYLEGHLIKEANSECMRCVCQEGYNGTLQGPWCQRLNCDYTFSWTLSVLRGCAPVFYEDDKCCADDFHCPSADDILVRNSEPITASEGDQCVFGDHRLNIRDKLLSTDIHSINCTCNIPPFITCVKPSLPYNMELR